MSTTTSARYGTHYAHVYGEGCPRGHHYFTPSEKRTRNGKPACSHCGGLLVAVAVTFALVPWRADGRYTLDDAIATYTREAAAEADFSARYAADDASPYVVRTFRKREA